MSDDEVLDEYQRLLKAAETDFLPASQARLRGAAEQTREAKKKLATLRPPAPGSPPDANSEDTPR